MLVDGGRQTDLDGQPSDSKGNALGAGLVDVLAILGTYVVNDRP